MKIREILKLAEIGIPSFSGIGGVLGIDKNTVIKIVRTAQTLVLKYDPSRNLKNNNEGRTGVQYFIKVCREVNLLTALPQINKWKTTIVFI